MLVIPLRGAGRIRRCISRSPALRRPSKR